MLNKVKTTTKIITSILLSLLLLKVQAYPKQGNGNTNPIKHLSSVLPMKERNEIFKRRVKTFGHGPISLKEETTSLIPVKRGGGNVEAFQRKKRNKKAIIASACIGTIIFYWTNRVIINEWFAKTFDMTQFKAWLLETLEIIEGKGNAGLVTYIFVFAWWEVLGLPTSLVETAAGMAFGLRKAFIANATGKSMGSLLAFFIGRGLLYDTAKKRFSRSEIFALIEKSVEKKPLRSALFMRYSSFPELMKNFGLSVVPLHPIYFTTAILVHGVPYSLLWSYVGEETKKRLNAQVDSTSEYSKFYNGILLFSGLFGVIVSPAVVAFWIRDMKKDYDAKKK